MTTTPHYSPEAVFADAGRSSVTIPRVLIAPARYIQGPGVLDNLARYLAVVPSSHPAVLISPGGQARLGDRLQASFTLHKITPVVHLFAGECSFENVARIADVMKKRDRAVDAIIAVGGGKCLDAGKSVAFRLDLPVITCPTIASTDAPCSAVSVMYTEEGVQIRPEFYPRSPAMVVVDSECIVNAPVRQFIAGMGDALATHYEVQTCSANPLARSIVGARPTLAVLALAQLCAATILDRGQEAAIAVARNEITDAVESVIEANTLLSGVGFESGGLAVAHAIAAGLTVIPRLHSEYLHGELVGIGLLTQLIVEDNMSEALRVAEFLTAVGLPVNAGQLSLTIETDAEQLNAAFEEAVASGLTEAEAWPVTPEMLFEAFVKADRLGRALAEKTGCEPYHLLHSSKK
ncbi:MAG: glycerol dehydrogenase [Desulfopila sp.]